MAAITISREMGSHGEDVGRKAAEALGYHFVDKTTIGEVLAQYGVLGIDHEMESTKDFWARFDWERETRIDRLNQAIKALARHGDVVIVGRGSFAVLAGFADVLNVRVKAPAPLRIARVQERRMVSDPRKAEVLVNEDDRTRSTFIESWYGVRWDNPAGFDLVVDTGKVSTDLAAGWLVQAAKGLKESPAQGKLTSSIDTDFVLSAVVSRVLKCEVQH